MVHFIVTLYIMLENIHGPFQEIIQGFKYDSAPMATKFQI